MAGVPGTSGQKYWDPSSGSAFASPTAASGMLSARQFQHGYDPSKGSQFHPAWWNTIPVAPQGLSHLANTLNDPYNIPTDRLNAMNRDTELAFNRAGNRFRGQTSMSGAREGGVAKAGARNIDLARGAQIARNRQDFEQYRQQMGDERLRSLLLPYLSQYTQGLQLPFQERQAQLDRSHQVGAQKRENKQRTLEGLMGMFDFF